MGFITALCREIELNNRDMSYGSCSMLYELTWWTGIGLSLFWDIFHSNHDQDRDSGETGDTEDTWDTGIYLCEGGILNFIPPEIFYL